MIRFLFKYFSKKEITRRKKAKAAKVLGIHLSTVSEFKQLSDSMPREIMQLAKLEKDSVYETAIKHLIKIVTYFSSYKEDDAAKALYRVYAPLAMTFKNKITYGAVVAGLHRQHLLVELIYSVHDYIDGGGSFSKGLEIALGVLDNANLSNVDTAMVRRGLYVTFEEELALAASIPAIEESKECAQEVEVIAPKRGKFHNNEQRKEAVAKVANGTSPTTVAEEYGISYNTMRNWVNKFNPEFAKQKYHLKNRVAVIILNESQVKDILASKLSREELAVKYKVSGSTITRVLNGTYKAKKG